MTLKAYHMPKPCTGVYNIGGGGEFYKSEKLA